jgi:hypothetical protein
MTNFIEKATEALNKYAPTKMTGHKKALIEELFFILKTAPFLTETEKKQISQLIPFFSDRMIENLKTTIIHQGLQFFKDYHSDMLDGKNL